MQNIIFDKPQLTGAEVVFDGHCIWLIQNIERSRDHQFQIKFEIKLISQIKMDWSISIVRRNSWSESNRFWAKMTQQ